MIKTLKHWFWLHENLKDWNGGAKTRLAPSTLKSEVNFIYPVCDYAVKQVCLQIQCQQHKYSWYMIILQIVFVSAFGVLDICLSQV